MEFCSIWKFILEYLEIIFLQTRAKVQKTLKDALNCCKLEIAIKTFIIEE